jgi:hypothetical protein
MTDEMRSSISLDLGLKLGNANRGRLPTAFPYANGAAFNSYELQHEAKCLPSTRIDLLRSVIHGPTALRASASSGSTVIAGAGKSTIARTVAQNFERSASTSGELLEKAW